jgi:hypothetical protein
MLEGSGTELSKVSLAAAPVIVVELELELVIELELELVVCASAGIRPPAQSNRKAEHNETKTICFPMRSSMTVIYINLRRLLT